MAWPVLLGCVWLWAGPALAEVTSKFENCEGYFYKQASPSGFDTLSTVKICQKYQNRYHFATLYDTNHRIPLWSAYTLDPTKCKKQPKKPSQWFVEPQLVDELEYPDMAIEAASTLSENELRPSQAINEDYEDTSYDRGHLNPNSFQCNAGRTATFTLTNAAPMDPCFNRGHWYKLEKTLKAQLTEKCMTVSGTAYLVTGTVPDGNVRIPRQKEDEEVDQNQHFNQVSVPSHVWTAVCCDCPDNNKKFSFAFLAKNKEKSGLESMPVEKLNAELKHLYGTSVPISIFADDCSSGNQKGKEVLSDIRSAMFNTLRLSHADASSQLLPPEKKSRVDSEISGVIKINNRNEKHFQLTVGFSGFLDWQWFFKQVYNEDNLSCVLTPGAAAPGLAKDSGTSERVCTLQEQKQPGGSRVTAQGWSCVGAPCGKHDQTAYSWCYTSHSRDWDYCCTSKCSLNPEMGQYECLREDDLITSCSPQYSTVTASGKPCRADHPCGLYGNSYYWCYTDHRDNWDYCDLPSPPEETVALAATGAPLRIRSKACGPGPRDPLAVEQGDQWELLWFFPTTAEMS